MIVLDPFADLPVVDAACRATIVIPARDEAARIAQTLTALATQRDLDGSPLDPRTFDVLVYANNCSDRTADAARAAARCFPQFTLHVAEETLPPNVAHIGTARRAAMHAASARYARAGIADAILCATDADTLAAPQWLAWTRREMTGADAVLGRILTDPLELQLLPEATRTMLAQENAYHFAIAQLHALLQPQSHDPWPRHWQRSGPSFAVRLAAYDAVGGVPPVRTLEDIALYDALVAAGARMRHSLRVRVTTSARVRARAAGGFGERIGAWSARDSAAAGFHVEDPEITLARLYGEPVGPPDTYPATVPATIATAVLRQAIGRGVSVAFATRSSVASIAG
jgi:glycosyltransferase involved in cell wall biosynthesis